jgi:hypothetical protein
VLSESVKTQIEFFLSQELKTPKGRFFAVHPNRRVARNSKVQGIPKSIIGYAGGAPAS